MAAKSDFLFRLIWNDRQQCEAVQFAVRHLRRTVDQAARVAARERAEWHDDPEAEDYAEYHAPADEQFPRDVRDEVIRDLVRYYVNEFTIQEQSR